MVRAGSSLTSELAGAALGDNWYFQTQPSPSLSGISGKEIRRKTVYGCAGANRQEGCQGILIPVTTVRQRGPGADLTSALQLSLSWWIYTSINGRRISPWDSSVSEAI